MKGSMWPVDSLPPGV